MLKHRNTDGTRTFTIRDIIDTLADANRTVIEKQKLSSKGNRFTAKDERSVYEVIFDDKMAQYGKLRRKSTKNV